MNFFDLHCDTLYKCLTEKQDLLKNNLEISLLKGKKFSSWIQCFAIWLEDELRGQNAINFADNSINLFYSQLEKNKNLLICKNKRDLKKIISENKIGAILTIEGSAALGGRLEQLDKFYKNGIRIITLTWNGSCEVGNGCGSLNKKGLTVFGKKVINKMQDLGIIIDLSHANDNLFYETASLTSKPIIATHSNSRKICPHKRNLTDEQFNIIKIKKGIIGLNFNAVFLKEKNASASDLLRHTEHFLELGGEDIISFGSDFDGADMPTEINGLESMENIYEIFLKYYKQELVNKIFFNNAYNFFIENLN